MADEAGAVSTGGAPPAAVVATPQTGTPATGPVGVPANASPSDWTTSLSEAQKLYVQNKGFKAPSDALESYQNYEKLMGVPKERLVKLPEKSDAPEWGEVFDRLGRPKTASEYKFAETPGLKANKEFTEFAQNQFHALGLSKTQGETLAAKWNEFALQTDKKVSDQTQANLKAEQTALTREWGMAFDQKVKECGKAAQSLGLGQDEVSQLEKALGYGKTMKFLSNIGSKLGEDSFVTGDQGIGFKGALTPEAAQAEIEELKKDKGFADLFLKGDTASKQKMHRLMQFAHPEMPQIS